MGNKSLDHFKIEIATRSAEETRTLGAKMGALLTRGLVIALTGDLGSGKTAFVQGIARGLQVPPEYYITSPTFTLINEYPGRLPLHHVDLYRIGYAGEADDIGLPDIMHGPGITAIEWAERIQPDLPQDHLHVHFEIANRKSRRLTVVAAGSVAVNLLQLIAKTVEEK